MVDLAKHAAPMPRRVTILGSTGSVGCSTLDLIARNPEAYRVTALTANSNVNGLVDQALKFRPEIAAIANEDHFWELKERLSGTEIHVAAGPNGLVEAASANADWVMGAIVGAAGLHPTLTAIRRGAIVALANKECLVCAGDLVMSEVTKCGATLLPVDSEHNAIFQVFDFARPETVRRIILTASGGPFRKMSRAEMTEVTADQAVAHPNWDMGAKISVDSATMMNKGLERIEAYHLFPVAPEQIEILVHPQSVIHSMVDYVDGSTLAQLGTPDMRTPIAYTLGWPKRIPAPAGLLIWQASEICSSRRRMRPDFPHCAWRVKRCQRGRRANHSECRKRDCRRRFFARENWFPADVRSCRNDVGKHAAARCQFNRRNHGN